MQFSAVEDIEVPIEHLFETVSDFESFERSALRRGADVTRLDSQTAPGEGMRWDIAFLLRGRRRRMTVELVRYEPPTALAFASKSDGLKGRMKVDLLALSKGRTRLSLTIQLEPESLSARLLVQSLKLARRNLSRRLRKRMSEFARDVELSRTRNA